MRLDNTEFFMNGIVRSRGLLFLIYLEWTLQGEILSNETC